MVGTGLSRILGFARQAVVSAIFGGGALADILNAVFLIPNNLRKLLAEGALSTAFVPVLTKTLNALDGPNRTKKFMASMFGFQIAILGPILLACVIFAEPISRLMFHFQPEVYPPFIPADAITFISFDRMDVSIKLFPWMMQYLAFVSFSAILMAVLNVHEEFIVPALAPLLFSVSVIVSLFIFSSELSVWAQVFGVLAGGLLQFLMLLAGFLKKGYRISVHFAFWKNQDVRDMIKLYVPVLAASSVFTLTEIIAVSFATSLGTGSTSAISNAVIFWQLPFGMFSASISTVLFPRLSRYLVQQKAEELRETVVYGLRMLAYLLIPSTFLLFIFGREIISVALQRGMFTPEDTARTAMVLQFYVMGMVFMGISGFLQRLFYAAHDSSTPFRAALLIGSIDIVLSLAGILAGFGVISLALANTWASIVGTVWLMLKARHLLNGMRVRSLSKALFQSLFASAPMSIGLLVFLQLSGSWWRSGSTTLNWIYVILGCIGSMGSVFLMYRMLKVDELMVLLKRSNRA